MNKFLKCLLTIFMIVILSGCIKNLDKLSYSNFNEYFSKRNNYDVIDKTSQYDIGVRKYIEAGDGYIQIFYIEFSNNKNANKYINNIYLNDNNYKVKNKKNYTYIKNKKGNYFRLYKKNNKIIYGTTNNKRHIKDVKRVLNELLN